MAPVKRGLGHQKVLAIEKVLPPKRSWHQEATPSLGGREVVGRLLCDCSPASRGGMVWQEMAKKVALVGSSVCARGDRPILLSCAALGVCGMSPWQRKLNDVSAIVNVRVSQSWRVADVVVTIVCDGCDGDGRFPTTLW